MVTMTKEMQMCMDECMACNRMCMQTMTYCMMMGGQYMEGPVMSMMQDCVLMCRTCADFMMNGSAMCAKVCAMCAEMCMRCAMECEKFMDDAQMMACAKALRECAMACEKMMMMA